VCGIRLGQGLGSWRTRGCLPRPDPTLNPHIAWHRKSKPVTLTEPGITTVISVLEKPENHAISRLTPLTA
jgi:hypothetical protein